MNKLLASIHKTLNISTECHHLYIVYCIYPRCIYLTPDLTSEMNQFQDLRQDQDFTMNVPTLFRDKSLLVYAGLVKDEQEDAFMIYSDDEVRMRALSGGARGSDHQSTTTDGVTRKTRLSFELHPAVFYEDFLPDDFFGNGDNEGDLEEYIHDIMEDMIENSALERAGLDLDQSGDHGLSSILFRGDEHVEADSTITQAMPENPKMERAASTNQTTSIPFQGDEKPDMITPRAA